MNFQYSCYQLGGRFGALLRVPFTEGVGYADCHPWESLGDSPLSEQLALLKEGKTTRLTARALHFARLDAEARSRGVNLFEGLEVPDSHFLLMDLAREAPEGLLKIKLGKNPPIETLKRMFQHNCRVRLDFNNKLTRPAFESFLKAFEKEKHKIEFCEDPFPYETKAWAEVQKQYGVPLACDQGSEQAIGEIDSAAYLIVKPAVQEESFFCGLQKIVVTSYLDHPLGQMAAAYVAGQLKRRYPTQVVACGLLSHLVYEENVFSRALPATAPRFAPPGGTGFGFDEQLAKIFQSC
jgi:O-succinylbenzoate synthase